MKSSAAISICITALFMVLSTGAHAGPEGPDHTHSTLITQEQALEEAAMVVRKLAERGKLPKSWIDVAPLEVEKKTFKKGPEWVVKFHNPDVSNLEEQNLFVFISLTGKVLAANYSGE